MRNATRIIAAFLAALMILALAACGINMSEDEIEDACFKEAKRFVGGYLSNSSTNYLRKYESDPEELLSMYKLKFRFNEFYSNSEAAEMVCDYILEHATFEVDPYSFHFDKDTERVEMAVNVTIISPPEAYSRIEDFMSKPTVVDVEQYEAEQIRLYNQAVSIISGIQPVTVSIPIELSYVDGEWIIQNHWMVMKYINEAA